jgi:putative spermidine/putrescine transport system substrate-binding protein
VVPINVVTSKLLAMVEANKIELDLLDRNEIAALILRKRGALLPIDYKDFKFTNPEDIASVSRPDMCPYCSQASVIVYNTDVFRGDNHPRSCADVWDTQRFPGPRIFQSFDIGFAELEFALLADGVPIDKLYPLDVDRAFKSLSRIKPSVVQFYDTGGTQLAMYSSKEAVTGSGYNGRIQPGIDNKQPVGIEWNQANIQYQIMAILKGCPNEANARKFLDFALQPQMQAEFAKYIPYGPTNKQAMKYISREVAAKLPTNYLDRAFVLDVQWWADNRSRVGEIWSKWILGK